MTAIQAARAAASLERDLGIDVSVTDGRYGELSVLVDDEEVLSAGPLGFLGILPTLGRIREAVKGKLRGSQSPQSTLGDA